MAMRTAGRAATGRRAAVNERVAWPATIPTNTVIGIYHGMLDAVKAAAHLRHARPESKVWIATGETGAELMQNAWDSRSWLDRIGGALGDESMLVERLIQAAADGQTVVAASGSPNLEGFNGAAIVVRFGRWTFGRVR